MIGISSLTISKGMASITTLLGLIIALLGAIQSHPNLPPQVKVQALLLAQQALTLAANPPAPVGAPGLAPATPQPAAPSATIPAMPDTPANTQPVAPAPIPFVRTGSASASLADKVSSVQINAQNVRIATISFINGTNETLILSGTGDENKYFAASGSTIDGYAPRFYGVYRSQTLAQDTRGILPGETATVQFFLVNAPAAAGSFNVSVSSYKLTGLTSGDFIDVGGFPIDLGTITAQ